MTEDLSHIVSGLEQEKIIRSNIEEKELHCDNFPYSLPMETEDFPDEKTLNKFIHTCERLIRTSPEYRIWSNYVREVLGFYSCAITGEIHSQTKVEIHHHPISLFTIVKGVVLQKVANQTKMTSLAISLEVLELHYTDRVGYIPLVSSLHEKFHNGFLQIPIEFTKGNFNAFIKDYSGFLEDDDLERLSSRLAIKKENAELPINWSRDNYQELPLESNE